MGMADHLTCLLRNLYAGQEATVRTGHGTTDWFQIGKGVDQGCILSLCLFNFYAEYIMWNARLDEAQDGIKIARRNINNLRHVDDTTLMAEGEEELKSLLMKVKEETEKPSLKFNIQKIKIMGPSPIVSRQIDGETVTDFIFLGSKITADGDCNHEIKRCLLLERKAMTNLDSLLKSRDITLPTKIHLVKAMVFPVVMYGCESWTIKKAEHWRIDALEPWCWRRLLRVPWTARRSNQSILKEISPKYGKTDAGAETPILWPPDAKNWLIGKDSDAGKDWRQEEKGTTEDKMIGWHHWLDGHEFEQAPGVGDGQGSLAWCGPWGLKELDTTEWLTWIELRKDQCVHTQLSDSWWHPGLQPASLLCLWNFPGKNMRVDYHFLLQGIFLTQGSNPSLLCLLHWQADSLAVSHLGKISIGWEFKALIL